MGLMYPAALYCCKSNVVSRLLFKCIHPRVYPASWREAFAVADTMNNFRISLIVSFGSLP